MSGPKDAVITITSTITVPGEALNYTGAGTTLANFLESIAGHTAVEVGQLPAGSTLDISSSLSGGFNGSVEATAE